MTTTTQGIAVAVPDSALLRATAITAAASVGPQILAVFRKEMTVAHKLDRRDQVTEHDRWAEREITERLLTEWPDSAVVGEEYGKTNDSDLVWYVDPIDGTSAFIQGLAFFSISIAALYKGKAIAGVVYDPAADEMFSADASGVYLNDTRLKRLSDHGEVESNLITGFPSARDLSIERNEVLNCFGQLVDTYQSVRRISSAALSLAYLAAGRAQAVFGTSVSTWDIAAGALLVSGVGGTFCGYDMTSTAAGESWIHGPVYVAHAPGEFPVLNSVTEFVLRDCSATKNKENTNG